MGERRERVCVGNGFRTKGLIEVVGVDGLRAEHIVRGEKLKRRTLRANVYFLTREISIIDHDPSDR